MATPQHNDDPFYSIVESVMRISLAGFGGALAGMSLSRRGAASTAAKVVVNAKSKADTIGRNIGKKRLQSQQTIVRTTPPTAGIVDRDLPTAWAVACGVFAGVVEFTRTMSPTTIIRQLVDVRMISDAGTDETGKNLDNADAITTMMGMSALSLDSNTMTTVSDYAIGGAIAGAIFQGSAIQTRARRGIDLTAIRGKPLSGILPGAALGLSAGILIVAIDYAQIVLEEQFCDHAEYDDEVALDEHSSAAFEKSGHAMMIPADIKAMSNEELKKSIEKLKKGVSEEILSTQLSSSSEDSSRSSRSLWNRIIYFWRRE